MELVRAVVFMMSSCGRIYEPHTPLFMYIHIAVKLYGKQIEPLSIKNAIEALLEQPVTPR